MGIRDNLTAKKKGFFISAIGIEFYDMNPENNPLNILPLSSKPARTIFYTLLAMTALSGLILLPIREIDPTYLSFLDLHVITSGLSLLAIMGLVLRRYQQIVGWRAAAFRLPLYLSYICIPASYFEFAVPLFLLLDWQLTKTKLYRQSYRGTAIKQARLAYCDFAVLLLSSISGIWIYSLCYPPYIILLKLHGLTFPMLLIWFSIRYVPRWPLRIRIVTIIGLLSALSFFGYFYYQKQVRRPEETDLKLADVYHTVEKASARRTLKTVKRSLLQGSDSCSGLNCHVDLVRQWAGSPHRFAVNNRFFQKQVALFIEMEGPEYVRLCINCHDPQTALTYNAEEQYARGQINNPEGVSCKACHSITAFDKKRGNGLYTIKAPFAYPFDGFPADSPERQLHDTAIRKDQRRHLQNFRRKELYRQSEYCLTCHLVTIPSELSGIQTFQLHTLFDQWRGTPWEKQANCVDCHMPRMQIKADEWAFFDHRIMGINTDLLLTADVPRCDYPKVKDYAWFTRHYIAGDLIPGRYNISADPSYRGNPSPFRFTKQIVRNSITNSPAATFLGAGPIINLEIINLEVDDQARLSVRTRTTNMRVGHNFPSGPIDVNEVWLEAILQNDGGVVVGRFGALDERKFVDPHAPILGSRGIADQAGRPLLFHEFWKTAQIIDRRVIAPFKYVEDRVSLPLPDSPAGRYELLVRWNFRRMNQRIVNWVWNNAEVTMPIMVLDYSRLNFEINGDPRDRRSYQVKINRLTRPPRTRTQSFYNEK